MNRARVRATGAGVAIVVGYIVAMWFLAPIVGQPIQALWSGNIADVALVRDGTPVQPSLIQTIRLATLAGYAGVVIFALLAGVKKARWDVVVAVTIAALLVLDVGQAIMDATGGVIDRLNESFGYATGLGRLVGANVIVVALLCAVIAVVATARFVLRSVPDHVSPDETSVPRR